jgi:HemY protein
MNTRLLLLIALLFSGTLLGFYMLQGSGYVLISFQQWVVETSLWVFLLLLGAAILIIYGGVQLAISIIASPQAIKNWRDQRSAKSAINKTVKGLIYLAEGDVKNSEKLLMAGAHGNGKIINYLAAARAAQIAGDYERSDDFMAQAAKSTKGADLAVGLQQAQLQLEREQFEQCLATCLRLKKQFPKNQNISKMLMKAYMKLNDWKAVLDILPSINKHKLLVNKEAAKLEVKAYGKLIEHMIRSRDSSSKNPEALLEVWKSIPKNTLKNLDFAPLAHAFIEHLMHLGAHEIAEQELRIILPHHFTPELVNLYGRARGKKPKLQLLFAQDQLKQRPNDAGLLLTLGRISMLNEEFIQAQDYFEASLDRQNNAEIRSELSRLYLAKREDEKALEMLRQGLGLELPELPLPS